MSHLHACIQISRSLLAALLDKRYDTIRYIYVRIGFVKQVGLSLE